MFAQPTNRCYMKKITLLLLLCTSLGSLAQIKGNVKDKSGEPLSFVSVYLENTLTGTTTNDNGDYELEVQKDGNYIVIFQYLGYKTLKKKATISSFPFTLNVVLEEEQVQLDEVKISTSEILQGSILEVCSE